jgi:hypothetical protein
VSCIAGGSVLRHTRVEIISSRHSTGDAQVFAQKRDMCCKVGVTCSAHSCACVAGRNGCESTNKWLLEHTGLAANW